MYLQAVGLQSLKRVGVCFQVPLLTCEVFLPGKTSQNRPAYPFRVFPYTGRELYRFILYFYYTMTNLYLQAFNILQESLQIATGYGMMKLRGGILNFIIIKEYPPRKGGYEILFLFPLPYKFTELYKLKICLLFG